MNKNSFEQNRVLIIILLLTLSCINSLLALTGTQIVSNADVYRTFTWTCESHNARSLNHDGLYDPQNIAGTHDPLYPFWPEGEPIGRNPDNTYIYATGQHTGVPYAWGLRETTDMFGGGDGSSGKLTWIYSGTRVLAGNHNTTYENDSVNKYGCKRKTGVRHQFCV